MEKSPTSSVATVMTFYNDLADEVDQHFARALQSAPIPMGDTLLNEPGQSQYSCTPHPSTLTTSMCGDLHITSLPATTAVPSTHTVVSPFSPPPAHSWAHQASPHVHMGQPYHTGAGPSCPPPPPLLSNNPNNRGTIIYPEFVNHLVHPDVDSFKDIPKLPGQTDPPPSTAASFSFCTNTYGQEPSHSPPPSYSLFHSPAQSDSPVHLSQEDLQHILELNKDNMYS